MQCKAAIEQYNFKQLKLAVNVKYSKTDVKVCFAKQPKHGEYGADLKKKSRESEYTIFQAQRANGTTTD